MKLISVPIASIDASGRKRPVTESTVAALMTDIAEDGLNVPIEVEPKGKGRWKLVAGAHRLEACRRLGHATIEATEKAGKGSKPRRRELMENLARGELTLIERAQYVAAAHGLYLEENPSAGRGKYDRALK